VKALAKYTSDLHRYGPRTSAAFVCPVCLGEFSESDVQKGRVARAHVFPRSMGGRYTTRACKSCDERIGDAIEGPVVSFLRANRVVLGQAIGRARCRVEVGMGHLRAPGEVTRRDGVLELVVKQPGVFDSLLPNRGRRTEDGDPPAVTSRLPQIGVRLQPYRQLHSLPFVLALKVAYYAAFERLGYQYILRDCLGWVRQLLLAPEATAPYVHTVSLNRNPFIRIRLPVLMSAEAIVNQCAGLLSIFGFWGHGFMTMLPTTAATSAADKATDYNLGQYENADVHLDASIHVQLSDSARRGRMRDSHHISERCQGATGRANR
jgi:hypothetical protein